MKIRAQKRFVNKMLNWYSEEIVKKLFEIKGYKDQMTPLTPVDVSILETHLSFLLIDAGIKSPNNSSTTLTDWPVKIKFYDSPPTLETMKIYIDREWEKLNVLYLDV